MTYISVVIGAAKAVKVSAILLLAICNHESSGLKNVIVPNDKGTPSYGICQVKLNTARMLGYAGDGPGLMSPKTNALYAAKYLKYQMDRYDDHWCKATAAYNSGTYYESSKIPGQPTNMGYIKLVRAKLGAEDQDKLECSK